MKKLTTILSLALILVVFGANAQTTTETTTATTTAPMKIGFANFEQIAQQWQKYTSAQNELTLFGKKYEQLIGNLQQQLQMLYQEAQQAQATDSLTEMQMLQYKQNLQKIENEINQTKQRYKVGAQEKFNTLLQPLHKKILTAIQAVGRENGYTYVLNQQVDPQLQIPMLIMFSSDPNNDLTSLVLAKLRAEDIK